MSKKIDLFGAAPVLMKDYQRAMIALGAAASFDARLCELVALRVSQINGCANCLNLHMVEAREHGETDQRLFLLSAWREAPCYTERERAALGWADALSRLAEGRGHAEAYETLKAHFSEEEQIKLTLTINIVGGWNRIAVGFGLFADPEAVKASRQAAQSVAA